MGVAVIGVCASSPWVSSSPCRVVAMLRPSAIVSTYSTPKNVATWSVLPKKLLYQTTPAEDRTQRQHAQRDQHDHRAFMGVVMGVLVAARPRRRRSGTSAASCRSW
jgi:hypothetical protein